MNHIKLALAIMEPDLSNYYSAIILIWKFSVLPFSASNNQNSYSGVNDKMFFL